MKHTSEEIKYRLSDLGVQIGNIAIEYITELEKENARLKEINTHTLSQLNLDNGELIIENEKLKKEIRRSLLMKVLYMMHHRKNC